MTIYLLVTETFEEARKDISEKKVEKLNSQNIYLVVRDQIKEERFRDKTNVIGFTEFVNNELPNRREHWQSLLERNKL